MNTKSEALKQFLGEEHKTTQYHISCHNRQGAYDKGAAVNTKADCQDYFNQWSDLENLSAIIYDDNDQIVGVKNFDHKRIVWTN